MRAEYCEVAGLDHNDLEAREALLFAAMDDEPLAQLRARGTTCRVAEVQLRL